MSWLRSQRMQTVMVAAGLCLSMTPAAARAQTLGVSGNKITVDNVPRFLVFVSYFDALDVPSGNAISDFDQLHAWGVDGIRIFPNWWTEQPHAYAGDPFIGPVGTVRNDVFNNMVWYLDRASERGMLVDISFSGESISWDDTCDAGNTSCNTITFDQYLAGVQEVASRLTAY